MAGYRPALQTFLGLPSAHCSPRKANSVANGSAVAVSFHIHTLLNVFARLFFLFVILLFFAAWRPSLDLTFNYFTRGSK